jgi:hypothetical protein
MFFKQYGIPYPVSEHEQFNLDFKNGWKKGNPMTATFTASKRGTWKRMEFGQLAIELELSLKKMQACREAFKVMSTSLQNTYLPYRLSH